VRHFQMVAAQPEQAATASDGQPSVLDQSVLEDAPTGRP
jgi:hypothetical protein